MATFLTMCLRLLFSAALIDFTKYGDDAFENVFIFGHLFACKYEKHIDVPLCRQEFFVEPVCFADAAFEQITLDGTLEIALGDSDGYPVYGNDTLRRMFYEPVAAQGSLRNVAASGNQSFESLDTADAFSFHLFALRSISIAAVADGQSGVGPLMKMVKPASAAAFLRLSLPYAMIMVLSAL